MRLIVLSAEEFQNIRHFVETGQRFDGVTVTDAWVESALAACVSEITALEDRIDIFEETARTCVDARSAALKIYRAWRKGKLTDELMNSLGPQLRSALHG